MKRSTGVTVIAILSLIGSILTFLMGLFVGLMVFIVPMPAEGLPNSPPFFRTVLLFGALIYVVPAIWGFFSSIGLLRLKNWARISLIVFSVLLIFIAGFGGLVSLVIPTPPSPTPAPHAVAVAVRWFTALISLTLVGLGIWWLIFLTREKVRVQFLPIAATEVGEPSLLGAQIATAKRPLSITILAWFMLVICMFIPFNLLLHAPTFLLTTILTGWPAALVQICFGALNLGIGIGLLRLSPVARKAAIAYFVVGFINVEIFYLLPGGADRMLSLLMRQQASLPWGRMGQAQDIFQGNLKPLLIIGAFAAVVGFVVPLYFLITRKYAFDRSDSAIAGNPA